MDIGFPGPCVYEGESMERYLRTKLEDADEALAVDLFVLLLGHVLIVRVTGVTADGEIEAGGSEDRLSVLSFCPSLSLSAAAARLARSWSDDVVPKW